MQDILIIDDEKDIRDLVSDILKDEGYKPITAKNSLEAFTLINQVVPKVILLDIWLQGSELDGLGILELIKKNYPNLPVIMMSGHGNIETAVNSLKMGAYDYLEKPFTEERLLIMVKRACEIEKLYNENYRLKSKINEELHYIAKSSVMNQINTEIDRIGPTSSRVIIVGESGTGKRTIAKLIHQKSARSNGAFVELSAKGLTIDQIETELFGGQEDFYVAAKPRKRGMLEIADNSTLYIEELMDLPLSVQTKLLKYLSSNYIELGGSNRRLNLNVRVIVSSKYDLNNEITKGNLNKDLYYRLNFLVIELPPLIKRKADIPELCKLYLSKISSLQFSSEALVILQLYDWPGNIWELMNIIEWLVIIANNANVNIIIADMLPPDIQNNNCSKVDSPLNNTELLNSPLKEAREIFERQYLYAQLNRFEGNIAKIAEFIGMERTALYRKLKLLNINFNEHTQSL